MSDILIHGKRIWVVELQSGSKLPTTLIIKQHCKLPVYNDVTVNIFMCILNNLCDSGRNIMIMILFGKCKINSVL